MKLLTLIILVIAVASEFYIYHALPIKQSQHRNGEKWGKSSRPAIFELNLYKKGELKRSCQAAEVDIDGKHIWITAAECLDTEKYDQIGIQFHLLGTINQEKFKLGGKPFHVHPDYERGKTTHNIGVVFPLMNFVESDPAIRRLHLPEDGEDLEGEDVNVFWYEETKRGDSYKIETAEGTVFDSKHCSVPAVPSMAIYNICAGALNNRGINRNDTGMPLVYEKDDNFRIAGIIAEQRTWAISGNHNKNEKPKEAVPLLTEFLKVEPYNDWIRSF